MENWNIYMCMARKAGGLLFVFALFAISAHLKESFMSVTVRHTDASPPYDANIPVTRVGYAKINSTTFQPVVVSDVDVTTIPPHTGKVLSGKGKPTVWGFKDTTAPPKVPASTPPQALNITAVPEFHTTRPRQNTGVPEWLSQCTDIYLDLGSNIGVQIRKLFEPEKYPLMSPEIVKLFDQQFGAPEVRKQNPGLCAFGFEPNPKHRVMLKRIEASYAAKGWKVYFFPYAVSNKNDTVTLWTEDNSGSSDYGATLYKVEGEKQTTPIQVKQIRLSEFIRRHFVKHKQVIKVMKMDIEGAEYETLPDLLLEGLLCKESINKIAIEWHQFILDIRTDLVNSYSKTRESLLRWIRSQTCDVTNFVWADDETYVHDVKT